MYKSTNMMCGFANCGNENAKKLNGFEISA